MGLNGATFMRSLLYVIRNAVTGAVKIGVSVDPDRRRRRLQTATDCELQLLGVFHQSVACGTTERQLLRRFQQHRLPGRGEWFDGIIRDELLALLEDAQRA